MRAVPEALAAAAQKAGVQFRYSTSVTALEQSGSRVTAVRTDAGDLNRLWTQWFSPPNCR